MDPITIITSTLIILEGISNAYTGTQKLMNLPKAFKKVNRQVPLIQELLQDATVILKQNPDLATPASEYLKYC